MDFHSRSSSSGFQASQPSHGTPAAFIPRHEAVHGHSIHINSASGEKGLHHLIHNEEEFHALVEKAKAGQKADFKTADGHHLELHEHDGQIILRKEGEHSH